MKKSKGGEVKMEGSPSKVLPGSTEGNAEEEDCREVGAWPETL